MDVRCQPSRIVLSVVALLATVGCQSTSLFKFPSLGDDDNSRKKAEMDIYEKKWSSASREGRSGRAPDKQNDIIDKWVKDPRTLSIERNLGIE